MGVSRLLGVAGVVTCLALMGTDVGAEASVTIGSALSNAGNVEHNCDASGPNAGCTVIQTALAGSRQLIAPFSGLIVRWRVRDYSAGTVTLRVVRLLASTAGAPPWTVGFLRSSVAQPSGAAGVVTYAASPPLPVAVGDTIGVTGSADNISGFFVAGATDTIMAQSNPADGLTLMSSTINSQNFDWLYNADIVAPPTSTGTAAVCPGGSGAAVTVTADPDPATGPKDVHFKVDGGPEHVRGTTGNPGVAKVSVPRGVHTVEFWGEDKLGQLEVTHHLITACASVARLGSLSETNRTFAAAGASTPLTGQTARRHPRGTTFSFRLDQPATLIAKLERPTVGRRVNHICKPGVKPLRHKPKCTVYANVATLTRTAHAGLNRLRFTGRIGGKALTPGSYQAIFTAIDTAGRSRPHRIGFTVVSH